MDECMMAKQTKRKSHFCFPRRKSFFPIIASVVLTANLLYMFYLCVNLGKPQYLTMIRFSNVWSFKAASNTDKASNFQTGIKNNSIPHHPPKFLVQKQLHFPFLLPCNMSYMLDFQNSTFPSPWRLNKRDKLFSKQKNLLILMYNRPRWYHPNDTTYKNAFKSCAYRCSLTDDLNMRSKAHAVVVNLHIIKKDPGRIKRPPEQIWVAFSWEPPHNFWGFQDSPAWKGVFNWTLTYRTDSDIFLPYGLLARKKPRTRDYRAVAKTKNKTIAWFVSNCNASSRRMDYVRELQKYIDVDIFGRCGPLKCPSNTEKACFGMIESSYYFYLSFENSMCKDYVTEKLYKMFKIHVVPVVRGIGADYNRYFPPNTLVNTADFDSPQRLAQHLKALMRDTDRYAAMLEAKDRFKYVHPDLDCMLCKRLHEHYDSPVRHHTWYPDVMKWIRGACHKPTDLNY